MSKAFCALIVLFLGWQPCRAQLRLSLQDAVNEAIRSRASLKADAEQVSVAEGLRKQAGVIPNPEFQFQNENLRPGQTYTRDVDTLAMINQPLDILGKRKQRMIVADAGVVRSRADYELSEWQVTRQVELAYWAVRGQQEVRDVLKDTADSFQNVIQFHAAQFSAGAIAEQDLLRVRLEGERLKIAADLAFIDLNRARMDLFRQMGPDRVRRSGPYRTARARIRVRACRRRAGACPTQGNPGSASSTGASYGQRPVAGGECPSRLELDLWL